MENKLKAIGIVVEYNPFHNGHIYHITKTKEIAKGDVLIAVMSPNFVQRGEPAFIDKWERTKVALEHGVDLVIEIPTHLTLQSAQTFSETALKILSWAKVDTIVYGSESLDVPALTKVNKTLLSQGSSYAKAKNPSHLQSNQILGAYYEKYAKAYDIKTQRIQRTNRYSSLDIENHIASASAIRYNHLRNIDITHTTPMALKSMALYTLDQAFPFIKYQILTDPNLSQYLLVDEGIENLLYKLATQYDTLDTFVQAAISKRYTRSRIQRTLCHILLKTPRVYPEMDTARVLGMSSKGQAYLAQIDSPRLTTSFKKHSLKDMEAKSTAVYSLLNKKGTPALLREMGPPIII
jgi:predicted nucleotidyltransferase